MIGLGFILPIIYLIISCILIFLAIRPYEGNEVCLILLYESIFLEKDDRVYI